MSSGLPCRATHDDVVLARREQRVIAAIEAELGPAAARRRSCPAALLVAGLVALTIGAVATSVPVAAVGVVLALGALVRAARGPDPAGDRRSGPDRGHMWRRSGPIRRSRVERRAQISRPRRAFSTTSGRAGWIQY